MHFHLPRRYRRPLLFPPGLLALAGLLWLGSVAIGSWQEKLARKSLVQLTMPPLHSHPDEPVYFSPDKLTPFWSWHDTHFNGKRNEDSISAISLIRKAGQMQAHPSLDQRMRVTFGRNATYAELVFTLNAMLRYGVVRYVLDTRHRPTTFYAFTVLPIARKEPKSFTSFCGTKDIQMRLSMRPSSPSYWSASYLTRFGHLLTALWNPKLKDRTWYTSAVGTGTEYDISLKLEMQYLPQFLREFRQSEWRIQFMLVIGMAAISWWKIKRQLQIS